MVLKQFGDINLAEVGEFWFKIKKPCGDVDSSLHDFSFTLDDGTKEKKYTIPGRDMLIPAEVFGFNDGSCYSAVFYTPDGGREDIWYIGNLFMSKYYTVFDQSPYDENGINKIQIGIGEKSQDQVFGAQHYDPNSKFYDPEAEELD